MDTTGIPISTAADYQGYPSIAFDGTNYLVVWQDYRNGSDFDIYGARVTTSGTVLDTAGIPISTAANDQWYPSIAFDGTNYLVVWNDYRNGSDYDIYGARVSTSGTVLDTAGIPISTAADYQWQPSIAFDGTNYFVVWTDDRNGWGNDDIYGARVSTSGTVLDTAGIPISTAANHQWWPSIAFDGTNYFVVWADGRNGSDYDIYGARVTTSGVVLDTAGIPISTVVKYQWWPSIAFDGTNYFVVWEYHRNWWNYDIYGARVTTSGTVLDTTGIPISTADWWQSSPSIAFDGINYLVVWDDYRGSDKDIYGSRVSTSGTVLDTAGIPISTAANHQEYPFIAFDSTNYLVVWKDYRSDASGDIYGARVSTSGTVLDTAGIPISTAPDEQEWPSIAFDGIKYLVVWDDYRNGSDWHVYGARVTTSGTVLDTAGIPISTGVNGQGIGEGIPSIAFDGTNYLVVWIDNRSGSDFDIYGARIDTSGTVLDTTGIPISTAAGEQWSPSIAFDSTNYFVVWQDKRNGSDYDIYGARVSTSGTIIDSFPVSIQSGNQFLPAIAKGSGNQMLVVYSGWVDSINGKPVNTYCIWGKFLLFDSEPPSTVTLISPSDNAYLNDSIVNFIWNKASDNLSGIDHYVLQYALDSSFTQGLVETTAVDTTFTGILSDTIYYWHIKAVDKAGNEGLFSTSRHFEVDTKAPSTPVLISPIGGIYEKDTLIAFQWNAVKFGQEETIGYRFPAKKGQNLNKDGIRKSPKALKSLVRYILQVDTTNGFTSPLIVDTLSVNTDTISLYENFPFYWRVKAYDLAGNQGNFSNPDSFGIDMAAPIFDSTSIWTDTSYIGGFKIATKVTDNLSGVDSVLLYYKREEDADWIIKTMHASGDWFTDTIPAVSNLDDTVKYYIKATDNASNTSTDPAGAPSSYYSFVANYTGIQEKITKAHNFSFGIKNTVSMGKVIFNLVLPRADEITLCIYDITGRLIDMPVNGRKQAGIYKIAWTSEKSSGVYFYRFNSLQGKRAGKFIFVK